MKETVPDNPSAPADTDGRGEQDHFFSAAKMMAGLTMISRLLGFVRDMVLVPLGAPAVADAFWTAFGIPHMFRRLFGEGALSAAFVPVFTESAETTGWARAKMVLANTAGLLTLVLTVLVALIEAGLAIWLLAISGDHTDAAVKQQMVFNFTMIMLPFTVFICLLALCSSALNARGHFAYPAAAPILLNIGLILTATVIAPALASGDIGKFRVVGVGLVVCSIGQLAGALWLLRRHGLGGRWRLRPILPEIRQIAYRMLPTVLPLGMLQIGDQLMKIMAYALTQRPQAPWLPLAPGVVRGQYLAGRLYQLPLGVLAISIATAVFPLMSRCSARGDLPGLRDAINRALRLCLFLSIPAGVGLMIIARPIITLAFQRADFTATDTTLTVDMIRMYCLGMPAYFFAHILLRAFFSRKDTRTPMYSAAVCTVLSLVLIYLGFYSPLRSAAFGLVTAVTAAINVAWLLWVLHRKLGKLGLRSLIAAGTRTAVATAVMAGATFLTLRVLQDVTAMLLGAHTKAGQIVVLVGAVVAGAAVFLVFARALGCPELGELRRRKRS